MISFDTIAIIAIIYLLTIVGWCTMFIKNSTSDFLGKIGILAIIYLWFWVLFKVFW